MVLPGRRAGMVLRKYLAQAAGRPQWSPALFDMGSFLEAVSGMRRGGAVELLFMLHAAHREVAGARAQPMDDFLQWAPVTLRDMSEVDQHLLDLDSLYRQLSSYEGIDAWSSRLNGPSAGMERWYGHWLETGALHRAMSERMLAAQMGTAGAVARAAAEKAMGGGITWPWKTVWFAGLNALEPAPTAVVKALQAAGKAELAWDTDHWYLDDQHQEAGRYLRRSMTALGAGGIPPRDDIRGAARSIDIVAVPDPVAQAAWAAQHITALAPEERARTAVVLADEQLLMPLLEALPADIGPVNVTMGLPLTALPIHGFTECFLGLHAGHAPDIGFRLSDAERLFSHAMVSHGYDAQALISAWRSAGSTSLGADKIIAAWAAIVSPHIDELTSALRLVADPVMDLPERFQALFNWAMAFAQDDPLRREQLYRMARSQAGLDRELKRHAPGPLGMETYMLLRGRLLREERIDLVGEPLSGLQVMGLLETRAIDHAQVVLLGASEGVLPQAEGEQSWIVNEVRRSHGLPLHHDREAITAYHVMRLLHAVENLVVAHPADASGEQPGPSRYLAQWAHELPGRSATRISFSTRHAALPVRHAPGIVVAKQGQVLERLAQVLARGLSPSMLATWLQCPLDFYFAHLMGIQKADELDGRLGSDVLGEAVHHVMEEVYRPWLGVQMEGRVLRDLADHAHDLLVGQLRRTIPSATLQRGQHRLRVEMAAHAMARHARSEAQAVSVRHTVAIALEEVVAGELPNGIRLKGRIDRVEERDGLIHILDLKTGGVDGTALKLKTLEREGIRGEHAQALQLLIYVWAFLQQNPAIPEVSAAIIPLRQHTSADGVPLVVEGDTRIHRNMLPGIAELLVRLVEELRDPLMAFTHSEGSRWCRACLKD